MTESVIPYVIQLVLAVVAIISTAGMVASLMWTTKNIKRSTKQEIEAAATEKADMSHFMAQTAGDMTEIKDNVKGIDSKIEAYSREQNEIKTDVAIVKRDLKTAFGKIDDINKRKT